MTPAVRRSVAVAALGALTLGVVARRSVRSRRNARLVAVAGRSGASWASTAVRAAVADPERAAELRARNQLRTAEQVAEALGHMKGAMMKLGQMASYLDQGLPDAVRDALAQLQSAAPPMASDLAAAVVTEELGAPPERLFAEWEPEPLAAASIGQVHRAVTLEGRAVAVKVQYPGAADAIAADLANTDLLFSVLSLLFPGLEPAPIVAELQERLTEELDYRVEAAHQRRFARHYRGHPTIDVPEVHDELSTRRVLTTRLAEGAGFAEVAGWPQAERDLAAETIYRFAFGGIYRLGMFNGDPHPGNYLFTPGGRVTFLDYGLCKTFTPSELAMFEELIRAMVLDRDVERFVAAVERMGILGDASGLGRDELEEYFAHFYELVLRDGERTITREYASESIRRFFDLGGPHGEIMKRANLPASFVIIQRINLGLFAVLAELGARGNWRRMAEEIWPFVDGPPSTPMGEAIARWEEARGLTP